MAFLVYFFVLLVAAGSVIFGLDLTQSPLDAPRYAVPQAQTATVAPPSVPAPVKAASAPQSVTVIKATDRAAAAPAPAPVAAPAAPVHDEAAQAQASATAADTTTADTAVADTTAAAPAAAGSCNVNACSAAYRSFRASDCTYQPFDGERRLCSKSATTGKVAAAAHPRSTRRADWRDDRRDSYYDRRDAYDDRRGGWSFFGGDY